MYNTCIILNWFSCTCKSLSWSNWNLGMSVFQKREKKESQEKHPWNKMRTNRKLSNKLNPTTTDSAKSTNKKWQYQINCFSYLLPSIIRDNSSKKQPHVGWLWMTTIEMQYHSYRWVRIHVLWILWSTIKFSEEHVLVPLNLFSNYPVYHNFLCLQ